MKLNFSDYARAGGFSLGPRSASISASKPRTRAQTAGAAGARPAGRRTRRARVYFVVNRVLRVQAARGREAATRRLLARARITSVQRVVVDAPPPPEESFPAAREQAWMTRARPAGAVTNLETGVGHEPLRHPGEHPGDWEYVASIAGERYLAREKRLKFDFYARLLVKSHALLREPGLRLALVGRFVHSPPTIWIRPDRWSMGSMICTYRSNFSDWINVFRSGFEASSSASKPRTRLSQCTSAGQTMPYIVYFVVSRAKSRRCGHSKTTASARGRDTRLNVSS